MPKQKPYEQPLQHALTKKPSPNQLIVLSLYQGSKTYPTYKLIGRYQPKSKDRILGPIGEKLTGVLIGGKIYELPTMDSLNKKVTFSHLSWNNSFTMDDMFRYSWNAFSEETDTVYKKQFEQLKKKEIKEIAKDKKTTGEIDPEVQAVMSRCGKGTRRNKVTGNCDPVASIQTATPVKRCPNGTRRNKVTKKCEKL